MLFREAAELAGKKNFQEAEELATRAVDKLKERLVVEFYLAGIFI